MFRQWDEFRWEQLKTPYPDDIRCLDSMAENLGLQYGYSEYWSARRANLLSRSGLHITPIDPQANFVPYTMSLNLDSLISPEKVQFVLTSRLDEAMIREFFGQARSVEKCGSVGVFIVEPQNSLLASHSNEGSLVHLAMLGLGEGSMRDREHSVIQSPKSADGSRIVFFGPYMSLAPGVYRVEMDFQSYDATGEAGLVFEVMANGRQVAKEERNLSSLRAGHTEQTWSLDFVVDRSMVGQKFEFRTWKTGSYHLLVSRVRLAEQMESSSP